MRCAARRDSEALLSEEVAEGAQVSPGSLGGNPCVLLLYGMLSA